jgi:putative ABC transport system permease protein
MAYILLMKIAQDLKFAFRRLRSAPGYTIAAVTTLALAIGATTAIFSAVYSVLLKPMPIRDPGSLVVGWGVGATQAMKVIELSYLDIQDIGHASPSLSATASFGASQWGAVLNSETEPVKVATNGVSGNFFAVVGAAPLRGRVVQPNDDRIGSAPVIVISESLWTGQFGSDPAIIGRRVQLNERSHEIVGVMPAAFNYPRGTQLWRAIAPVMGNGFAGANPDPMRNVGVLFILSRLRPGATLAAATGEATRAEAVLQDRLGGPKYDIALKSFLDHEIGPARQAMWALAAAVGVLLLIACANVSGLMLTRVSLRNHDDAIRLAIGGSRIAVARVWAAETVWLILVGGALGLLTANALIAAIVALAPEGIPRLGDVAIDQPVAFFSITVMALATLLCGATPMRHASVVNLVETLNDGSRTVAGGRSYRTRSSLLVVQIGLAVVLLVAAGIVVRSFTALRHLDLGFTRDAVLRLKIEPSSDGQAASAWIADLLSDARAMNGVASAGAVYLTPMELGAVGQGTWTVAEGQVESADTANNNPMLNYLTATPEYFKAMGVPLVRGRLFTEEDRAQAPRVALISESTAAAFFPGRDPIGKRIKAAAFSLPRNPDGAWRTIVGVVGNVRYRGLHEIQLDLYDPPAQSTLAPTSLVIRMKDGQGRNALAVAAAIQTMAKQRDARALISGITLLEDIVNKEIAPWRFSAWVFALFAALAFGLAMLGLFSLVSLDVVNRRREFAIRMAVGATGGDIVRSVFRSAGVRAGLGIAGGVLTAAFVTRGLQALLFEVKLADALTYASVVTLVAFVVALASYLPARRAANTSPLSLLRRE